MLKPIFGLGAVNYQISFIDYSTKFVMLTACEDLLRHHAPWEWVWHISTNYKWRQWYSFGVSQLAYEYLIALMYHK